MSPSSSSSTMIPFERYDEEFASLTEQVTSKLRALDPRTTASSSSSSPSSSSADADVRMAHALLLQADDLLKQMGLEARGVEDASVKRDLLGKVSFGLEGGGGTGCIICVCVCVCCFFWWPRRERAPFVAFTSISSGKEAGGGE